MGLGTKTWLALPALLILFSAEPIEADRIIKKNGTQIEGAIVAESATTYTIRTPLQIEIRIPKAEVAEVEREIGMSAEERDADGAMAEERLEAAIKLYESALEQATQPETRQRLEQKIATARERIRKRDELNMKALFASVDELIRGKAYAGAAKTLESIERDYAAQYPQVRDTIRKKRALIHLHRAADAFDSVNPRLAEQELYRALELDPELLEAHLMAIRHFEGFAGTRDRLVQHLEKAVALGESQLDSDRLLELKFKLAQQYFQAGEYEKALPLYTEVKQKALTRYPLAAEREIDVLSALGDQLLVEDIDLAIERYRDAIDRNPNHPRIFNIRRRLGELYLTKIPPEPQKALAQFEKLQSDRVIRDLFYLMGQAYMAMGEPEKAIESFEREIAVNKSNYNAYIDLARLYMEEKRFSEADQVLQEARQVKPDSYQAFLLIGRLRRLQERYEEAKSALNLVLAKEPDNQEAQLLLGLVLLEEGDLARAADYFDRVIEEYQRREEEKLLRAQDLRTLAEAHLARGRVDLENKQTRRALNRFDEALEIQPDMPEVYFYIGEARRQLSNFQGAEEAYLQAIDLQPAEADYHLALGLLYHNNLNEHEKAIREYNLYFDLGGLDFARVNRWLEELGAEPRPVGDIVTKSM